MRGIVRLKAPDCRLGGITPACAGNSEIGNLELNGNKDHPRVCGE